MFSSVNVKKSLIENLLKKSLIENFMFFAVKDLSQQTFTCSNSTIKTLEKSNMFKKYVQS